jgi:UDP-N-acetylmuramoyl-tripeptide--D-alanyl-D-alanine ligase
MKTLTLAAIADFGKGALTSGRLDSVVGGVSTDTRTLSEGQLYVALEGERFDGHDYVATAFEKGAAAVMVAKKFDGKVPSGRGVIRVGDTLVGLQCLARCYRRHLGLKVVGITGSNGKTSTKDLVASVLRERFVVNATRGNLNNHIGLPLTILNSEAGDGCGVWEMGMSHPGEIEILADIARPDVGIITNIGVAHLEYMKTREAIAEEKGMLAEAICGRGLVVLNAADEFTPSIRKRTRARVITAGIGCGDVYAEEVTVVEGGMEFILHVGQARASAFIPVSGRHMVANALMAAAVGFEFGLGIDAIVAGLAKTIFTGGRLQRKEAGGVVFIDDSYNANPDSVRAAIETFVGLGCVGRRFAVLGGMAELGESGEEEHRVIGREASESGIDVLVSVGALGRAFTAPLNGSSGIVVEHFDTQEECAAYLRKATKPGDCVLVKGSRSAAMEKVLEHFQQSE